MIFLIVDTPVPIMQRVGIPARKRRRRRQEKKTGGGRRMTRRRIRQKIEYAMYIRTMFLSHTQY